MQGLLYILFHRTVAENSKNMHSDSQFFSEIYSDLQQTEPRAAKPIRRLFQEQQ